MGRTKLNKSEPEVEEQKARYRKNHNDARRRKYAEDAAYRQTIHAANRMRYRTETDSGVRDCATPEKLLKIAKQRTLELEDGSEARELCLDNAEMAEALGGYHPFVFHRWQRSGRFPRPIVWSKPNGSRDVKRGVFLLEQATQLLDIVREHQKRKFYLTKVDQGVITALFAVLGQSPPENN